MGAKEMTQDKRWVVAVLNDVMAGGESKNNYPLMTKLIDQGYIKAVFVKIGDGRGRPSKFYEVSEKGKNLIRLASKWPEPKTPIKPIKRTNKPRVTVWTKNDIVGNKAA